MRCWYLICCVGLMGCATNGLTATQNTKLTACNTYANALVAITPYKAKMTASQIAEVNAAVSAIAPYCENPAVPGNETVPAAMQQAVTTLANVEASLKGGK